MDQEQTYRAELAELKKILENWKRQPRYQRKFSSNNVKVNVGEVRI